MADPIDLPPDEMLDWATADPDGYHAAVNRSADRLVEREVRAGIRRRGLRRRERLARWLRGSRRA